MMVVRIPGQKKESNNGLRKLLDGAFHKSYSSLKFRNVNIWGLRKSFTQFWSVKLGLLKWILRTAVWITYPTSRHVAVPYVCEYDSECSSFRKGEVLWIEVGESSSSCRNLLPGFSYAVID
jgi:hypothetical protein